MTGMLASANNLTEALLLLNTSVDIIDLKQPALGALGALPNETVKQIVQTVNKRKPVSATIGDLPMQAELIFDAVTAMANTDVDYIKIGFFPGGDWQGTLSKLANRPQQRGQLIAVLFADEQPDFNIIKSLKNAGISGVMLDTLNKSKGSLVQVLSGSEIEKFVQLVNDFKMLCGLAGSLKQQDIPQLLQLNVDYLGFRGALCKKNDRTAKLDTDLINSILTIFQENGFLPLEKS